MGQGGKNGIEIALSHQIPRMDCRSCGYGESRGSSRWYWSSWTPGCCLSPFQHIPAAPSPAFSCSSAPQDQLRAAAISTLGSPGLPLPGRPDADQAGRASINYSSAEHRRQQGMHQLLQRSMGDPWPNPTGTKPPPGSVPTGKGSPCPSLQVRSSLPAREEALAQHRLSCTNIPKLLHGDAQLLCLNVGPTNLWGLEKETQRMTPFCKETAFEGSRSVWILGGLEGSADPLWTEEWKREAERYVHIRACIL